MFAGRTAEHSDENARFRLAETRHVAAQLVQFVVQTIYLAVLVLLSATRLQKEKRFGIQRILLCLLVSLRESR